MKRRTWWWVAAIIIIDLAIYFAMLRGRRANKNRYDKGTSKSVTVNTPAEQVQESFSLADLPRVSAIHLFGGFHVYDAQGEDITKQFSPMLRELLSLIIIYSPENGISANQLKDILWFDKETKNARNNRSVYLGKLRALLNGMGEYSLSN